MSLLTTAIVRIIRHAESGPYGITQQGGKKAKKLGEKLRKEFGDDFKVITSPAKRASETAEAIKDNGKSIKGMIISAQLAIPQELDSYLCEEAVKILKERGIGYTQALLELPENVVESLKRKSVEIIDYLKERTKIFQKPIIAVSHSGLIEPIIFTLMDAWDGSFTKRIGNLEGVEIQIDPETQKIVKSNLLHFD